MVAMEFISRGNSVNTVLSSVGLSKSVFYYHPSSGKRGGRPSSFTLTETGERVSNEVVVHEIESLLSREFVDYGYIKIAHYLKQHTFLINKKKVYRLMKDKKLLLGKRITPAPKRPFVQYRKISAEYPYQFLEMDIKYIYIHGEKRNVFLLTILDLFSRKALGYTLKASVRKKDVISLFNATIKACPNIHGITVRNDNGSQFIAYKVREHLFEHGFSQEFIHPGTPEEIGHIEALHSIIEREVVMKYEFENFEELYSTLDRYFTFYNAERIHSSIGFTSPDKFLAEYYSREALHG